MLVPWYVDVRRTIAKTLPLDTRHLANCWSWTTLQLSAHDPDLPFSFSSARARDDCQLMTMTRGPTTVTKATACAKDQTVRTCEGQRQFRECPKSSHMRRSQVLRT